MDVAHLGSVLWRFKNLVAVGVVLGGLLAIMSVARPVFNGGVPKLEYRSTPTYLSNATVFVTQPGFPWGRTTTPYLPGNTQTNTPSVPTSDAQRLSSLTSLYAQLAVSDQVRALLPPSDRRAGALFVAALPAPPNAQPPVLPLLRFSATAATPSGARKLVNDAASAFQRWLAGDQQSAGIPAPQRVMAQIIASGSPPKDTSHHSKSLPIMIFLAVVAAAVGLALTLENVRLRVADAGEPAGEDRMRSTLRIETSANGHNNADGSLFGPRRDFGPAAALLRRTRRRE